MPSEPAVSTARAQLAALAREAASADLVRPSQEESDATAASESRPAAVLILFGVLDSDDSEHAAQADAVSEDLDVLLLLRASTLRSNPGQVAFPGGRMDPEDDGPVGAALREAREETGLDPSGVEVLGVLENVPLAYSQHLVTPVLAWWRAPSPVRVVDEAESAAVFRASVADLLNPANRGVTVIRRDGWEWRGPGFLVPHETGAHLVWGFTGMLLDGIFDRLGWTEPWDDTRELPLVLPDLDVPARS
jgi:8-oxo-dGTP pyrophosphatase MutT (NUDIX family)